MAAKKYSNGLIRVIRTERQSKDAKMFLVSLKFGWSCGGLLLHLKVFCSKYQMNTTRIHDKNTSGLIQDWKVRLSKTPLSTLNVPLIIQLDPWLGSASRLFPACIPGVFPLPLTQIADGPSLWSPPPPTQPPALWELCPRNFKEWGRPREHRWWSLQVRVCGDQHRIEQNRIIFTDR